MAFKLIPEWIPVPSSLTVYAILTILFTFIVMAAIKRRRYLKRVDKVPGMPGGLPLLGNTHLLMMFAPEGSNQ